MLQNHKKRVLFSILFNHTLPQRRGVSYVWENNFCIPLSTVVIIFSPGVTLVLIHLCETLWWLNHHRALHVFMTANICDDSLNVSHLYRCELTDRRGRWIQPTIRTLASAAPSSCCGTTTAVPLSPRHSSPPTSCSRGSSRSSGIPGTGPYNTLFRFFIVIIIIF